MLVFVLSYFVYSQWIPTQLLDCGLVSLCSSYTHIIQRVLYNVQDWRTAQWLQKE